LVSPQFDKEECRVVVQAKCFCAPVAKCLSANDCDDEDFPGLNPRIDYTCYKVTCADPVTRRLKIEDQFGERAVPIRNARLLCAPTTKQP
jgi:hypothetical protein